MVPQEVPERQWSQLPPLVNSLLEDTQPEENSFYDIWAEDTMSYPYSEYRDGDDDEAHIRDFLTTWEIDHAAQRLSTTVEDKSKIAEFVRSLDGPSMSWFTQNGIRANHNKIYSTIFPTSFVEGSNRSILCSIPGSQ